jgi:outer membrane receptor protein involved in Fe transport
MPLRFCAGSVAGLVSLWSFVEVLPARAQGDKPLPPVTVDSPDRQKTARATQKRTERSGAAKRTAAAPKPQVQPAVVAGNNGALDDVSKSTLSQTASAQPAATTGLDAQQIQLLPVATYTDLFRSLPGFNIANFGQGGIASGISLRGYTESEHGRDIAYYIDGVPVNDISSLHTPNYADLNILLPESVKSIEITRGPFSVEYGDSNLGGSVDITTKNSEPFGSVGISGGTQGTVRGAGTYSTTQGGYLPFIALEGYRTDGSRDNSFIDRYNSFNKITTTLDNGATVSFRAQAYGTDFGAPGYANRDAVQSGQVAERTATNPTDGGNKQLENFVANYSLGPLDQELKGALFVSHDYFNRYADFGGGQRLQHDERTMAGGRVSKVWTGTVADQLPVQVLIGSNWRSDIISAFQAPTTARTVTGAPVIDLGLTEHNIAAFGQLQIKPLSWLKLTAGGRFDQFFYDIHDRITPGGTPDISPGITTPKFGVAITPLKWLELFANYGQGFRSIDVPLELIGNPGLQPFKIVSREGGIQFSFDRWKFLADYWTTESANEGFQAAPGLPVTFLGRARRDGFDLDGRFFVVKDAVNDVALFANYGGVQARLLGSPFAFYVPNVPDYVANIGVDFNVATRNGESVSGTAYATFVSKKHLTEDGQINTVPYARVTGKLGYNWPAGWSVFTQATYYPGDRLSEIAFDLADPVTATSADIFTNPQPVLVVLAGLTYRFPTALASGNSIAR